MFATEIPGLRLEQTGKWLPLMITEKPEMKTPEFDGRGYLGYLKEMVAKADDVPESWVTRDYFMNSTVLWVVDPTNWENIIGCLVFKRKESVDALKHAVVGIDISHISVLGSDADFVELGTAMIVCLKCFLLGDDKKTEVFMSDPVLNHMVESNAPYLVFTWEVEHNKKPEPRVVELMQACGFKKAEHKWTASNTAIMFEYELKK
jgi:hypothetical protein